MGPMGLIGLMGLMGHIGLSYNNAITTKKCFFCLFVVIAFFYIVVPIMFLWVYVVVWLFCEGLEGFILIIIYRILIWLKAKKCLSLHLSKCKPYSHVTL